MDGKKTWIGLILLGVGHTVKMAAGAFPEHADVLNAIGDWVSNAGAALTAVGAAHKIQKGE
jgi:hypothetical protein